MRNLRMKEKLERKDCIDVSQCARTPEGDYILREYIDDVDYCDAQTEDWIWSIGKNQKNGVILASTSAKFYQNPDWTCLWLR